MPRVRALVIWIPLIIALIIVGLAAALLLLIWAFGWGNTRVIYWLAYNATKSYNNWTVTALGLFLGSAFVYLCVEIALRLVKSKNRALSIAATSIFLVFFASLLLCGAGSVTWWQTGFFGFRDHVETARLANNVYHLHFYSSDAAESYNDYYYIYECDSLDFLCRSIYTVPRTTGGITPDVTTIHIFSDPNSRTLSLEINGEIVYTHEP